MDISLILKDFGDWLREREEFDYIIDGANVAYCNQNFMDGKFSYMQALQLDSIFLNAYCNL